MKLELNIFFIAIFLCGVCYAEKRPNSDVHSFNFNDIKNLASIDKSYKSKRVSSYDKSGANVDYLIMSEGESRIIFDEKGPGCITHIWMTVNSDDPYYLRTFVLRMFWENEELPAVECPLGDFFGLGHAELYDISSTLLATGQLKGLNCYFPMPFNRRAKITISNEGNMHVKAFYYQFDFETFDSMPENLGRFYAKWSVSQPCYNGIYEILHRKGVGRFIGCAMFVQMVTLGWWGEGDDIFYIDDMDKPAFHGTGSEDYFCGAWMFEKPFSLPMAGCPLKGGHEPGLKWGMYRFHLDSPIRFDKEIKFIFESDRINDYSSVAYWYEESPMGIENRILPTLYRLPRGASYRSEYSKEFEDLAINGLPANCSLEFSKSDSPPMNLGTRIRFSPSEDNQSVDFHLYIDQKGKYKPLIITQKAPTCGRYKIMLDEEPICEFDSFSPVYMLNEPIRFPELHLKEGNHKISFVFLPDKDDSSRKDLLLDCVLLSVPGDELFK